MKITMYELLGLVKDGKAPKIIKYKDTLYEYDSNDEFYFNNGWSLYREFPENGNCLNDEVEILEEEKKIPEKLNLYYHINNDVEEETGETTFNDLCDIIGNLRKHEDTINSIIDYLKSKGE